MDWSAGANPDDLGARNEMLIGAVLGEFFGSREGLGYAIKTAQARPIQLIDQLWGSIFVLGLMGGVATLLIGALERYVLHWHSSQRL